MPKKCCISNCKLQQDDPGCLKLSFFQVPCDENTRNKWYNNINQHFKKEIQLKKYSCVCALHFEPTCFNYGGMCKVLRLKKGSYPTVFDNYSSKEPQVKSTDICSDDLDEKTRNVLTNPVLVLSTSMNLQKACNISTSIDHTTYTNAKPPNSYLQDNRHSGTSDNLADTVSGSQISEMNQSSTDSNKHLFKRDSMQ